MSDKDLYVQCIKKQCKEEKTEQYLEQCIRQCDMFLEEGQKGMSTGEAAIIIGGLSVLLIGGMLAAMFIPME